MYSELIEDTHTTLGYIVSQIGLELDLWNNITKSCVYFNYKMFHQEASVETIKMTQNQTFLG